MAGRGEPWVSGLALRAGLGEAAMLDLGTFNRHRNAWQPGGVLCWCCVEMGLMFGDAGVERYVAQRLHGGSLQAPV